MSSNYSITHDEEVNRMEQLRCSAVSALEWLDSHERLRIALNARSRHPKLVSLTPGTIVYFHKPPGQHRRLQDNATGQQGPAIVAATEGTDKVWVRYKGTVVRVALENIRLATPEETLDTRYISDVLNDMQQELTGANRSSGYEDITESPAAAPSQANTEEAIVATQPVSSPGPIDNPKESDTAVMTKPEDPASVAQDVTHAPDSAEPSVPPVPSNVLPEADQTEEVLRQLELSRLAADRLDGYRPVKSTSRTHETPNPSIPTSSNTPPVEIPLSLEDARVKHKVEYFEGGAQAHVWDAVQDRLGKATTEANDSALKRARLEICAWLPS